MLFLLRPPQTYMPYWLPRDPPSSEARSHQLQKAFSSTRRIAAATPSADTAPPPVPAAPGDLVAALKDLGALHESGALSDDEFATAKARLLSGTDA